MVEHADEPVVVDVEDTKMTFEEHKAQTAPEVLEAPEPYTQPAPQSQPSVIIADNSREEKQWKN